MVSLYPHLQIIKMSKKRGQMLKSRLVIKQLFRDEKQNEEGDAKEISHRSPLVFKLLLNDGLL